MKRLRQPASPLILRLSEVGRKHLARAGAKAVNLGCLLRVGLPVPDGFVVTAEAFARFAQSAHDRSQFTETLQKTAPGDGPAILSLTKRIGALLGNERIDEEIEALVRGALRELPHVGLWAVRSSAMAEDSAQHSFAGQYDSFLNVRAQEVIERIRQCWLCAYNVRSITYRIQNQVWSRPAMAVIVQQMVPAERAGVLFTADPISGARDRFLIEAVPGLGDKLVAGEAAPESSLLARGSGERIEESIDEHLMPRIMDAGMCKRLVALGQEAEAVLTGPLDIEWAACGDRVYLLQARPITGGVRNGTSAGRQAWTNMNTGEVLPDVITPMTWSLLQRFLEPLFQSVFRLLGVEIRDHPIVGLVGGRVYFNVNTGFAMLKPFGFLVRAIPKLTQALGGAQADEGWEALLRSLDLPDVGFRWRKFILSWPHLIRSVVAHSPRRADAWTKRVQARNDLLTGTDVESMPTPDLVCFFARVVQESFEGWDLLYVGIQALVLPVFDYACRRWLNDPDLALGYRLFAGLGGIPQAEAGLGLWNLAALAHRDPQTQALISSGCTWESVGPKLIETEHGRNFLSAWTDFMGRHGHHCRSELELYSARWSERPDYILAVVRTYIQAAGQCSPPEQQQRLAQERQQLTARCRLQLTNPIRRWIFSWALMRAQKTTVLREVWKNEVVRIMALLRRVLLVLGARLKQDGTLSEADDVFFLEASELNQACSGHPTRNVRELVAQRRETHARNSLYQPPPVVFGEFEPALPEAAPSRPLSADVLKGIPVSPGTSEGLAKVILRTDDHAQVQPGEILVAPFTDPAWTPYFVPAAGVVTDLGGILSHGSIVAREYGIPAVTNVGCATRSIQTGDLLQVDGTRGEVRILKRIGDRLSVG